MQKIMSSDWAVIINPKSGKKKFRQQRKYLFLTLKHAGIRFESKVTKFAGHAAKIAKLFAEQHYQNFMVLGGDGTLHEVINGIFSANIAHTHPLKIALIPRGTGNDWGRFWGLTRDYKHSIDIFLKGNTRLIDIGKVMYSVEGEAQTCFFINSIGFGLDALVAKITNKLKQYIGSHSFIYTFATLLSVFSYRASTVIIESEKGSLERKMIAVKVANGSYSGGGMQLTPHALPYDGLLDVMIARKPGFLDVMSALPRLFNGKLLEHRIIKSFQTTNLNVTCHTNVLMEADGIIINGESPYTISIIRDAIKMVIP